MGTPNGPFAIRHSLRQVLENAQNGKGQLLAEVGIDLGSSPRSFGVGVVALAALAHRLDAWARTRYGPMRTKESRRCESPAASSGNSAINPRPGGRTRSAKRAG